MANTNNKATIVSMAVIASAAATLLHEGLGHGVTAWLRGDIVTEITSNHLSAMNPDHWVEAGGTIVNAVVGSLSLWAANGAANASQAHANRRYFLWLLAALNLLPAAGYFMLSGIVGFGDWSAVISDSPHKIAWRIAMTLFGAASYYLVVQLLGVSIRPFAPDEKRYNTVSRLPYYAAGIFSCAAGAFDPLGIKLLLISTIPAAFGGSSGLIWGNSLLPKAAPEQVLTVRKQPVWWILAIILGASYIVFLGRGIHFSH